MNPPEEAEEDEEKAALPIVRNESMKQQRIYPHSLWEDSSTNSEMLSPNSFRRSKRSTLKNASGIGLQESLRPENGKQSKKNSEKRPELKTQRSIWEGTPQL